MRGISHNLHALYKFIRGTDVREKEEEEEEEEKKEPQKRAFSVDTLGRDRGSRIELGGEEREQEISKAMQKHARRTVSSPCVPGLDYVPPFLTQ